MPLLATLCALGALAAPSLQVPAPAAGPGLRGAPQAPAAGQTASGARVRIVPVPINPAARLWQVLSQGATGGLFSALASALVPSAPGAQLLPGTLNIGVVYLPPAQRPWPTAPDNEVFLIYRPFRPAQPKAPVLVHFHSYGRSPADLFDTNFLQEAMGRDWYLVAPLQREPSGAPVDIHYSSVASQAYAEAAIDFVLSEPDADPDRIYAYGFSMGGGAALNYAARHLAPDDQRFAAVVCHTGTLALPDVYTNAANTTAQGYMETIFGGSPSVRQFEYMRSSVLELAPNGLPAPGGNHTVHNLRHVPVRMIYAAHDPNAYLVSQARAFESFMSSVPGAPFQVVEDTTFVGHAWSLLDAFATCEWFATKNLASQNPIAGTLVADREASYLGLTPRSTNPLQLARFDWSTAPDRVEIVGTRNVTTVTINSAERGLDPQASPFWILMDADGDVDRVVLEGFTRLPQQVTRTPIENGVPIGPTVPATAEVVGTGSVWRITTPSTIPAGAQGLGARYLYQVQ